jgi:hypothetical protein
MLRTNGVENNGTRFVRDDVELKLDALVQAAIWFALDLGGILVQSERAVEAGQRSSRFLIQLLLPWRMLPDNAPHLFEHGDRLQGSTPRRK